MIELLQAVVFWHWWVLGVGLLVLEVLAPGSFFLWLAVAAGLTGLVKLVAPGLGWEIQLVLFAVLSVATLVVGRAIVKRHPIETTDSTLNRRGEQHVGRVYALAAAIENGRGTLRLARRGTGPAGRRAGARDRGRRRHAQGREGGVARQRQKQPHAEPVEA
jgi:inner membrane protein